MGYHQGLPSGVFRASGDCSPRWLQQGIAGATRGQHGPATETKGGQLQQEPMWTREGAIRDQMQQGPTWATRGQQGPAATGTNGASSGDSRNQPAGTNVSGDHRGPAVARGDQQQQGNGG
jgi:hypothetical protein